MVKLPLVLLLCVTGCKKEEPAPTAGSGSARAGADDTAARTRMACMGAVARTVSLAHETLKRRPERSKLIFPTPG